MISIGNDIVALSAINPQRTNDIRFHSKFITPQELALYPVGSIPFVSFVWLLWSIKESAFKYQKRLEPELIFAPTKIEVSNIAIPQGEYLVTYQSQIDTSANAFYTGKVIINQQSLNFKSIVSDDVVATIVADDFQNIHWGIQQITSNDSETQSSSVREALLNKLKTITPQGNFSLQKSGIGYPVLLINDADSGVPISLSHHQNFTSYCFKLNKEII